MNRIHKSKLPPGPKPLNPLGQVISFRQDSLAFLKKIGDEYGDIVFFKMGPIKVAFLNHPDYLKEVLSKQNKNFVKGRPLEMAKELLGEGLLTSEGDFHRRQSRIIQHIFHRKMVESYAPAVITYTQELMDNWQDGQEVDIMDEMVMMSTSIAGKAFFNVDLQKEAPAINEALNDIMSLFGRITLPMSEILLKLPLPSNRRFYKAKKLLTETIKEIVAKRRQNRQGHNDLLSLLLDWRDEEGNPMEDQHIEDEALTLLLTAFDTTSLALTWTWYLLSQNPDVETALHEEVDKVLQGKMPSMETYHELSYTRQVMGESMRVYPPLYIIAREALEDFSLGEYDLPGGTLILMSPYLMHRDPRFFKNSEKFDPKAWGEHLSNQKSKYEYIPFSQGPRACIGQPFAWLEGILAIAAIAQSWRLELVPGHPVELDQVLNLRPKHGMKMIVRRRK